MDQSDSAPCWRWTGSRWRSAVKALTGGFRVQPGSITTVIGPNGAGKTSLFNTISGFYHPASGQIRFQGADITRKPAPERARLGLARSFRTSRCSAA